MIRHKFAKGYITTEEGSRKFIRVEESYDGQSIEFFIGDPSEEINCGCDCGCSPDNEHSIDLTKAQVKELMFCIRQLHFIDKPKEKKK